MAFEDGFKSNMKKFDLSSTSAFGGGGFQPIPQPVEEKRETVGVFQMIPLDKIKSNENNFYSIDEIKELALNISITGGIEQNLVVIEKNGEYILTTGDRRKHALDYIQKYKLKNYEKLKEVPCMVRKLSDLDIPKLSDAQKEDWLIISTNANNRKPTQADMLTQAEKLKGIYETIKDKDGVPEEYKEYFGNASNLTSFLAENMNVSPSTANKLTNVTQKAIPSVNDAVKEGKISLNDASKIAKKKKTEQAKIMHELNKEEKAEKQERQKIEGHNKNIMPPPQIGQPVKEEKTEESKTPKIGMPKLAGKQVDQAIKKTEVNNANESDEQEVPVGQKLTDFAKKAFKLQKKLYEIQKLKPSKLELLLKEQSKLEELIKSVDEILE